MSARPKRKKPQNTKPRRAAMRVFVRPITWRLRQGSMPTLRIQSFKLVRRWFRKMVT